MNCKPSLAFAVVLAATALASFASADMLHYQAFLDSLQVAPPDALPGTGVADLILDDSDGDWTLTGSFLDLIGTTTSAQLRGPADPGQSGALISLLTSDLGVTAGTMSGSGTLTMAQMTDLGNGKYYVEVRTTVFPGGEIRGQFALLVPEPSSVMLLGLGALGMVMVGVARWQRRKRVA